MISKGSYRIITLCSSTKFKKYFMAINLVLTLSNWIVLSIGSFHHSDNEIKEIALKRKEQLDLLYQEKIRKSNAIFVIDVDGYIGDSTKSEIEYAKIVLTPIKTDLVKHIFYWSNYDIYQLIDEDLIPLLMELIK